AKLLETLSAGAKPPLILIRAADSTKDETWTPRGDEEAQAKALIEFLQDTLEPKKAAWIDGWDAAAARAKEGKLPFFAVFLGAPDDAGQKVLDEALGGREVQRLLSKFACVRVATHGDAGKDEAKRLEALSPGAKAPFVLARGAESATDLTWPAAGDAAAQKSALVAFLNKALEPPPKKDAPAPSPGEPAPPKPGDGKPAEKPADGKPAETKPADAAK
ncbi:MAG TPA: hypothetical protein VFS92_02980, partial [Planctomycetota bacterium]|nr:hypothetical protein [Planctomycetota bacterium]